MRFSYLWISILVLCFASAEAVNYYVSPSGNDGGEGTSTAPFQTIQRGMNAANPGDTVLVGDGVYTCDAKWTTRVANYIFGVTKSGTADKWITIKAQNKWGAKLSGDDLRCYKAAYVNGDYVRVEGFDMYGFWNGGISISGDHNTVSDCHFHDMSRECTDNAYGMGGAVGGSGFSNGIVERNLIHDNGRLHPEDGCTELKTGYYANHDHALYMGSFNGLIVRNNVFYNNPSGWFLHIPSGTGMQVINNTFAFKNPNRNGHIILWESGVTNSLIANNIFYQPGAFAVCFLTSSTIRIENNITDAPQILGDAYNKPVAPAGVTTSGNILEANILLANPSARDFHLQAGSPAIDKGLDLRSAGVIADYDRYPRPYGPAFDIGAYEYTSSVPNPSSSLVISSTSYAPGAAISVVVTGGSNDPTQWVALCLAANADANYSYQGNWKYLNGTQTAPGSAVATPVTLTFTAPMEPGTYNLRLFANTGVSNRLAVSSGFTVTQSTAIPPVGSLPNRPDQTQSFAIRDIRGRIVGHMKAGSNGERISQWKGASLQNGIYFVDGTRHLRIQ